MAASTGDDAAAAKTIVFFHPDLGIGGAERLVVDAAVGLQERGHRVVVFTNHCDPAHCFDECRDGTLDVRVRGDWLVPMSLLSRLTILCAVLRHAHLVAHIALTGELRHLQPSAFIVDQLSAGLPLLRRLEPRVPILFYCHFPDLLLAQGRDRSLVKRLYRVPFDRLEQWTMSFAHAVAVNSRFTRGVVDRTWPGLKRHVRTSVLYPCVDTAAKEDALTRPANVALDFAADARLVLSINRFERKKDIALAIKAFAAIPPAARKDVRLVLAGGYDPRVSENVQYHTHLEALAAELSLAHHTLPPSQTSAATLPTIPPATEVLFLLSVPDALKTALLRSSRILVYTPSNEHFGIVPLEAMLARVPVLAANTGGPVETVQDGVSGWLRDPDDVNAWSAVIRRALELQDREIASMGEAGADSVRKQFGRDTMALRFEEIVKEIVAAANGQQSSGGGLAIIVLVLAVFSAIALQAGLLTQFLPGLKHT